MAAGTAEELKARLERDVLEIALADPAVKLAGQQGGSLAGVAVMGFLSALIVGPCAGPVLIGALLYTSQSGDYLTGALAMFALGNGMGAPLLVICTSGGKLLPKAGGWMNTVKAVFGVILLGVAVLMLERVLPGPVTLALWALLLIIPAIYMRAVDPLPEIAEVCSRHGVWLHVDAAYAGSAAICDPELTVSMVIWDADTAWFRVHNPTDREFKSTFATPTAVKGFKVVKTTVTVPPGASVEVR